MLELRMFIFVRLIAIIFGYSEYNISEERNKSIRTKYFLVNLELLESSVGSRRV